MKNTMSLITAFLIIALALTSCNKLEKCDDEELSINLHEYSGNSLRLDGFYYYNPNDEQALCEIIVLFKNGVVCIPEPEEYNKLDTYLESIPNDLLSTTKYYWGVYDISNNEISINHWEVANCGLPTLLHEGNILNDTTFILKKTTLKQNSETTETQIEKIYHFKHSSTKPDSTRIFIN